jgi:hypothetical protein
MQQKSGGVPLFTDDGGHAAHSGPVRATSAAGAQPSPSSFSIAAVGSQNNNVQDFEQALKMTRFR